MILDFHSHILPGLDHGSADMATSLEQIKLAQAAGVRAIAATSHFYPHRDRADSFLDHRRHCWQQLQQQLAPDAPAIVLGAEVLLCEGMEHMEDLEALCLPSGALLLEMPFGGWNSRLMESLFAIHDRFGENLVLAHVERYPAGDMLSLLEAGIRGQINGYSLCRLLGRRQLLSWIKAGYIAALGSDIHGTDKQYEALAKAVRLLGDDYSPVAAQTQALMGL